MERSVVVCLRGMDEMEINGQDCSWAVATKNVIIVFMLVILPQLLVDENSIDELVVLRRVARASEKDHPSRPQAEFLL